CRHEEDAQGTEDRAAWQAILTDYRAEVIMKRHRSSCDRPVAQHRSRSGRSAPGSARLCPQGRDEASDGRRIDPSRNAEHQTGREDDLDRGIRDYANRGEGWRGSRRGAGCGVWLPVSEFPPPGVEGGFGQAAGGTERSDRLTRSLPGADGVTPELL